MAVVTDSHGYPVRGATVTFSSGAGLTLSSATAATNESGQSIFDYRRKLDRNCIGVNGVGTTANFSLTSVKSMLLVRANSATYTFDQPIPAPTYTFISFKDGDTACWTILSFSEAMPSGRFLPSPFSI